MMRKIVRGQGAMEYLLLIGGAVLVGTVVLLVAISSTNSANDIIDNSLGGYTSEVSLHAAFGGSSGGGGAICGDGSKNQASEFCDGADLAGATCNSLGFAGGGTLGCNSNCTYNTSSCSGGPAQFCGNNVQEGTEDCDGSDLASNSCTTVPGGFTGGTLSCNPSSCTFNTSACTSGGGAVCGNNTIEGSEVCDGTALAGQTCVSQGFTGGTLSCNSGCTGYDTSACTSAVALSVNPTPVSTTGGRATYAFTWTGSNPFSPTPGGFGNFYNGITLNNAYPVPVSTLQIYDILFAMNPSTPGVTLFNFGSGSVNGSVSNHGIKYAILSGTSSIGMLGNDPTTFDGVLVSNAIDTSVGVWNWPTDTEAPLLTTYSAAAGAGNGGEVKLDFTEPWDQYLGATVQSMSGLYGFKESEYTVGWCSNASCPSGITPGTDTTFFDSATVTKKATVSGNPTVAPGPISATFNYSDGVVPSTGNNHLGIKVCDRFDAVTPVKNCAVYALNGIAASKEAKMKQMEDPAATLSSFVTDTTTYPGETVVKYPGSGCGIAGSSFSIPVTLLQPSGSTPTYRVFFRYGNTNSLGGQRVSVQLGTNKAQTSLTGNTGGLIWSNALSLAAVPASTNLLLWEGTTTTPSCTGGVFIDRIVATTDPTCVPTGDGSNCGAYSP